MLDIDTVSGIGSDLRVGAYGSCMSMSL